MKQACTYTEPIVADLFLIFCLHLSIHRWSKTQQSLQSKLHEWVGHTSLAAWSYLITVLASYFVVSSSFVLDPSCHMGWISSFISILCILLASVVHQTKRHSQTFLNFLLIVFSHIMKSFHTFINILLTL